MKQLTHEDFEKFKKEIIEVFQKSNDINAQGNIIARESITPSLTPLMFELKKSINENAEMLKNHIEKHDNDTRCIKDDIKEIRENQKLMKKEQDPVNKAYRNATGFTAVVLTVSMLLGAIWGGVTAWKNLFNK